MSVQVGEGFAAHTRGRPAVTVLPMGEFTELLKDERVRADRTGSEFCLVVFYVADDDTARHQSETLSGVLASRRREADLVGWLDGQHLGVLLPFTGWAGSERFLDDLQRKDPTVILPHAIFQYGTKLSYLDGQKQSGAALGAGATAGSQPRLDPQSVTTLERRLKQLFARRIPGWKRALDVVGALFGLIVFVPVGVLLAAYIKLVSPGPFLFKQQRVGYKGEPFTFLKFRTMRVGNDVSTHTNHLKELIRSDKPMEKLDESADPRIIPGGRIIRKSCMDEVPQLINVLKGEMSLVGPRPCLPYEAEEYRRWHAYRFDVLPGITGQWQVSGKNKLSFAQMIRLDIDYCATMSLWRDVKILLLTGPAIFVMIVEAVARSIVRSGRAGRRRLSEVAER